ncbi:unnamed protein product [marine sediment metagenome]|uniref:Uncharacterized protein n=1 Tax=marine sediment metagenome TaxID=412755 RepID=X1T476_9ZZZZ
MSLKRKMNRRKKPAWIQLIQEFHSGKIGPKLKERIENLAWFDSANSLDGYMVSTLVSTCSYCGREKEITTRIWSKDKKKIARLCGDCVGFLV